MKKIFTLIFLAALGIVGNAQCTYTLELFDSFGDTWNGASLDVAINGTNVANFANSGATSPETYTFLASTGDVITLTYNTGSFDTENSYNLIDADGVIIFTQTSPPAVGLNFTGTATCPSCSAPISLGASGITPNSASLNWTSGGSGETNWDVEFGVAPYTQTLSPTVGYDDISNPVTVTGLAPATTYEYWVRADCDAAAGTDESAWSGPFSFTTECTAFVAPYDENFDAGLTTPVCWTTSGAEPWLYQVSGGAGPDYGVAGSVDHTTGAGNFAWIDASGGLNPNELISPFIDFSSLTQTQVGYWILSNNVTDLAQNTIELSAWDGTAWVLLDTYGANNANWIEVSAVLPLGFPLTTTQFRLVQVESTTGSGSAFHNDLLVDDFFVREAPTCIAPTLPGASGITATSAVLDWTTGGSGETNWDIEFGVAPFTPTGTPTLEDVTSNPYTLTPLSPSTTYTYYVRADCDGALGTDESLWTGPFSFTTSPTCIQPTALTATGITTTTADLSWTSGGSGETNWDVEFGVEPYVFTGTPTAGYDDISNPVTVTGLSPATSYEYWVRADCDAGLGTDESTWAGPFSFTTPCVPFVAPYSQNFDAFPAAADFNNAGVSCWNAIGPGANDVELATNTDFGVPPPSLPNIVEFNDGAFPADTSILVSPQFTDLPSGLNRIRFTAGFESAVPANVTLIVGVMTDPSNSATFTPIDTLDASDVGGEDLLDVVTINLDNTGLIGSAEYVAFLHGPGAFEAYMDDFFYEAIPSCIAPTALTASAITGASAVVSWTSSETLFDVAFGVAPFASPTVPNVGYDDVANGVTLTGLSGLTTYEYWVRADCDGAAGTDESVWAGPFSFTTQITPLTCTPGLFSSIVYSESFEDAGCTGSSDWLGFLGWSNVSTSGGEWRRECSLATGSGWIDAGAFDGSDYAYFETTGATGANTSDTLTTVDFDISTYSGSARATGHYLNGGNSTFITERSTDAGATWTTVFTNIGPGGTSANDLGPWALFQDDFSAVLGSASTIRWRFIGVSSGSTNQGDIGLDLFEIEACVSCPPSTGLVETVLPPDSALLQWSASAPAAGGFVVQYRAVGAASWTNFAGNPVAGTSALLTGLSAGDYEWQLASICSPSDSSVFVSGAVFTIPQPNDDCVNAESLNVYAFGASVGFETAASTASATHSIYGTTPCDGSAAPGNLDLFYTFTMPAGETAVNALFAGPTSTDIEVAVYDACGGTNLYCDNNSATHTIGGLTPGSTYILQVWHDDFNAGSFTVALELPPPPPVNDDCANAIPVFSGYSVTGFSTENSTTEATGLTSCVFSATNAVWFTYTPTCDVTFEVNTNGTSALPNGYDTQISLWDDCSYTNELACDDDGGTGLNSLITFAGIANTTYYIRVSGFGGQTGEVNFEIIETVPCPCAQNVWTGANSTAWSDDLNWTCGTAPTNNCGAPLGSDIAIVPAGAAVTPVVTGTLGASSLEVGAGSSITIDGTLQVCGNVEHNGNAFTGAGNLELAGTATQMLSGNGAFGVLELNNTAGASVMGAASLSVDSALVLTTGTFTNNGSFSLNSALGGTAYLDDFTGTGSYSGDLTANRFVTDGVAGGLGQRLFGSAVSGSTVTGLDNTYGPFVYPMNDYIIPVAACDPDSLEPASPYSNLMSYDENVPTFCSQAGWFALNSNTAVLTSGRGYSGWMNNGSTISVTGAPNTGAQSYGVLSLTPANSQGAGYHVLSNPYPSPVLISEITNGTGLSSVQYYESSTGAWSGTYQPAAVSGLTVPVMQGFTALSDGTASLSLDNADRVASTNGFFAKSNNWFDYRLDVEVTMNGNGDITYLYYSSNSTDQFDVVGDCEKRESDSNKPTLYTRSNNKMMSLNGLNLNDLGTSVPMGLIAPTVTTASFSFTGMDDFPANTSIYVEDKVEGIFHNVTDGDYTFEANPAQNGSDRFEIHFVLPASFNLVEPTCENTNGTIIENTNDGRAFEIINNNTVVDNGILDGSSNELAAGDYTIEVYDQFGGSQLYDFTVEEIAAVSAGIISSASAIEAGESVDFEFSGADATNYEWTIDGQVVAQTEMFSYQFVNPGQYEVAVFASNEMCEAIASYTIDVAEKTTAISTVGKGSLAIYGAEGNVVLNFVNINQGEVDAAVYNLLGQEVASLRVESSGKQTIQNVNWADGYYLVKVQIGEQVVNETVLLTK